MNDHSILIHSACKYTCKLGLEMEVQERVFLISNLLASATIFTSSIVLSVIFSGRMVNGIVVFQKGL